MDDMLMEMAERERELIDRAEAEQPVNYFGLATNLLYLAFTPTTALTEPVL